MPNEIRVVHSGPPQAPVVILLSAEPGEQDDLCALLSGRAFSLVSIAVPDWNADLSPWPAPRAFPKGEDFAGRADAFLQRLLQKTLPEAEASLGFSPCVRLLVGYSLSGLFALYALAKTGRFDGVASASGSLWYDGFLDFFERALPGLSPRPVYLSLGDREAHTKNARLAQVLSCTRRAHSLLLQAGFPSVLELNPGSHFVDYAKRMARAVSWLLDQASLQAEGAR